LKKSIYINIDIADIKFKKDLLVICDTAVMELKKAKNKEILNVLSIEYLVKLVFSLQGNFPNNWNKKSVNLHHNWKLDRFRKVTYMQTNENKVNAIFDYFGNPQNSEEREKVHELFRKRDIDFKGNAFEFVEWFKKEYTDIYLQIF
jgi:hypothetical protein